MDKLEYLEQDVRELKDAIKEQQNCRVEIEKNIVVIEQSQKSFHKRIDKVEETLEILREVANSIKSISEKVERTVGLLEGHDTRLVSLEKAPGDFFKANAKVIFTSFLTGIVVALITLSFKKIGG